MAVNSGHPMIPSLGAYGQCEACDQIAHLAAAASWENYSYSLEEQQAVEEKQRPVVSLFIFIKHKINKKRQFL